MQTIFSPFNVPIKRRLQTAAVFYFIFVFLISPVPCIILPFYLLFTSFWWLSVAYLVWFIYDFNTPSFGGRASLNSRNSCIWKYFTDYFPIKLVKTAELTTDRNYILGSHPHGVISIANFASFCTHGTGFNKLFPGIRQYAVTLRSMFYFPIRREIILNYGAITSDSGSIEYVLNDKLNGNKSGRLVSIVLGGAEEALDSHPDNFNLKLSSRRGFVRLALQFGASLVPAYHFGETSLYYQVPNEPGSRLRTYQTAFKSVFGISPPIFFGRGIFNYVFGVLPYRSPITTVVGAPIDVKKNENPTNEEISELHKKYCKALSDLFDAHKTKYGISKTTNLHIC